jgi:uncharacterized protein YkwD
MTTKPHGPPTPGKPVPARLLAGFAALTLAAAAPAAAQRELDIRPVEDRILDTLQEARKEAGSRPLERRAVLDGVAAKHAEEIASLPKNKRLSSGTPIEKELDKAGSPFFRRAASRLIMVKGVEPVRGVLERWRGHAQAWNTLRSPEIDAVGLGTARAQDGWFIFFAVLVEDAPFPDNPGKMEKDAFRKVNRVRREYGLGALARRTDLDAVAAAHARDMATRSYLDHRSPEGKVAADRVRTAGIRFERLAENLASNRLARDPVQQAVDGWMASAGHRKNILERLYTHTGMGVAVAEDGTVYFAQIFLRP